jgi:DNA-binding transcriptional LysR family regulator
MDTRQLVAFCTVVERESFSQAAQRLGVTQPAVSLQVRALEKRLGRQLLDRSGRRVVPTEAGLRLYRSAQRMLAAEQQLLEDVADEEEGALRGRLEIGASTGPGGTVLALLLCEFQRRNPELTVALSVLDTRRVIDLVLRRELELGVVGAARRQRSISFEPFFRDEVVLVCPPGHRFAGRSLTLDELREEPLIVMQKGAGVRAVIEEELRRAGTQLRDFDVHLELGLQESVKSAVIGGFGVTFISRSAVESELAAGTLAAARVEGLEPAREISLVRSTGRAPSRVAEAFVSFARGLVDKPS